MEEGRTMNTPDRETRVALPRSSHPHPQGALVTGSVDTGEPITVTVMLRENPDNPLALDDVLTEIGGRPPAARNHFTREQFARAHGAHPADLRRLRRFAQQYGMTVSQT